VHNYPWYREWQDKFAKQNVTILGVHTPETEGEKQLDKIKEKVKENKLTFPTAIDNDGKTWKAWGNNYWPSVYLIDKKGDVRYRWDGELDWKEAKGQDVMRKKIEELLAEKD
jgi:peroxiredoxin